MESPKMRRMRRHTSLNARLQQHRASIGGNNVHVNPVLNKSNPYVGWFRHAPSSSPPCMSSKSKSTSNSISMTMSASLIDDFQKKNKEMQKSPYVGWFRHSPPLRFLIQNKKRIAVFDRNLKTLTTIEERRHSRMKVDGFLRGGAPASWLDRDSIQRTLRDSSAGSPSATIQVLSRLATWFLFPLAHDQSSCGYRHHHHEMLSEKQIVDLFPHVFSGTVRPVESDDDCSTITDDENHDDQSDDTSIQTIGTHLPLTHSCYNNRYRHHQDQEEGHTHDLSVSSLAEAYYAHQAAEDFDRTLNPNDVEGEVDDGERLDFVITQMDIARMARNASRHLDVASILSLPTITYHHAPFKTDAPSSEFGEETGASWLIVPPAEDELSEENEHNKDGHVCVICLEHFQQGDRLRVLPCSHSFHVGCIDRWLSGSHSFDECVTSGCPTCKKTPTITTMDGSVPSWAFSRLGETLANGSISSTSSAS